MTDVTLHSPVGCAHCHPQGELLARAENVAFSEFFEVFPPWAQEGLNEAVTDFHSITPDVRWTERKIKHLNACISAATNVERNCLKQIAQYGEGKTRSSIKRHKRTRSQIRAAKGGSDNKSENKKKGGKK